MTHVQDLKSYYAIVGVASDASATEIRNAYRVQAMALHPDRNAHKDTTQAFQLLQEAYSVLSDELSRAHYDAHDLDGDIRPTDAACAKSPSNEELQGFAILSILVLLAIAGCFWSLHEILSFTLTYVLGPVAGLSLLSARVRKEIVEGFRRGHRISSSAGHFKAD